MSHGLDSRGRRCCRVEHRPWWSMLYEMFYYFVGVRFDAARVVFVAVEFAEMGLLTRVRSW